MIDIVQVDIRSFRSITNFKIPFKSGKLNILCGSNNVGKTNVLRAIRLLFNPYIEMFDGKNDVPFHIAEVVRGNAYKVEITGHFTDIQYGYEITTRFIPENRNSDAYVEVEGTKKDLSSNTVAKMSEDECHQVLESFRIVFIEANNIDLPSIISDIFVSEVLTDLDKLRKKQWNSLEDLRKFQESSHTAMQSIENNLTRHIQSFSSLDGANLSTWKAKIKFPEFNKLRDAISKLVNFTIQDTNDLTLDFKGSGAQKIVLLAIMKYMASEKSQNTIWLLDEPEAFLQPGLQKQVFNELNEISKDIKVMITTHSQHFVNPADVSDTYLLISHEEPKVYKRKAGRAYILNSTKIDTSSGSGKIEKIKNHLGLSSNDAWAISPKNILVEGGDDKTHIFTMLNKLGLPCPNILVCGGADKLKGYLQFLLEFSSELSYKPEVKCILDHDKKGKEVYNSLYLDKYSDIKVTKNYVNRSTDLGGNNFDYEFEDMIPHEILIEAVNRILKARGYKKINKSALKNRYSASMEKLCVLDMLQFIISEKNTDETALDFTSPGLKIYLNKKIDEVIESMHPDEFREIIDKNSGLKSFLLDISNFAK